MREIATLAGGCFWCTEAIFKRLKGLISAVSGYAGGSIENPSYERVSSGATGHAEAIQIEFNPTIISYEKILDVFWATHDPTTLNRQGADVGTQYRSVIFYYSEKQKEIAEKSKQPSFVTQIIPFDKFYKAEDYHQNSYEKILDVFWATHDPTTLNRQGADVGTQYRSVIFYHSETQKEIAERSKEKMQKAGKFKDKIVTQIIPFDKFYKAEDYHQNFYDKNKWYPYCQIVINPKIQKLLEEFGKDIKEDTNIKN